MLWSLNPLRWPLAYKVPTLVALFMLAVSVVITNAVLAKLKDIQERHLAVLSAAYLDGLASAIIPYVLRDDVWDVFDAIDRRAALGGGFGRAAIVVVNSRGETLASSFPKEVQTGSDQTARNAVFSDTQNLVVTESDGQAHARKELLYQGRVIGQIFADYDISHLLRERQTVLGTLVATNAAIALMLAALGYWAIRRMLSPLGVLSRHLARSASGPLHPVLPTGASSPDSEIGRLFQRYNALAEAMQEREAMAKQLAAEERLASLGRLATGLAHEINNPLGGLFNAIDTLKRHGDRPGVRSTSVELIERGLRGIRDVVRTVLETYRPEREARALTAADLDDMRFLISPEASRKAVQVVWENTVTDSVSMPPSEVRQILLNLALNAVAATPGGRRVIVTICGNNDELKLEVRDEGPGLPAHAQAVLAGASDRPPSFTEGGGLGLWMTRRMVSELGGQIMHRSPAEGGTLVAVTLPAQAYEVRYVA